MVEKKKLTIKSVKATTYQPDQPGSDKPGFVYKKGKVHVMLLVTYEDGSGKQFLIDEEQLNG